MWASLALLWRCIGLTMMRVVLLEFEKVTMRCAVFSSGPHMRVVRISRRSASMEAR